MRKRRVEIRCSRTSRSCSVSGGFEHIPLSNSRHQLTEISRCTTAEVHSDWLKTQRKRRWKPVTMPKGEERLSVHRRDRWRWWLHRISWLRLLHRRCTLPEHTDENNRCSWYSSASHPRTGLKQDVQRRDFVVRQTGWSAVVGCLTEKKELSGGWGKRKLPTRLASGK